jgi:S1-C subfamily serine protease
VSRSHSHQEAEPWETGPQPDGDPAHGDPAHGDPAHGDPAHGDPAHGDWPGGGSPDPCYAGGPWRRRPRSGLAAALTVLLALAMAAAAGALFAVLMHRAPSTQAGINDQSVYDRIAPSIVDIESALSYDAETAEGTGFVIDARNGLVLTNNHVIAGSTMITATLPDTGHSYPAKVVGDDADDDVALLQLQGASRLTAAPLDDSPAATLGAPIVGIGNQGGQGGAPVIAPGYISSLGRTIRAIDQASGATELLRNMLEVTAQIQPGDSGGPLANAAGQVIGMDTAATQPTAGVTAAGFAIPIAAAVADARAIAAGRTAPGVTIGVPGFLGVVVALSRPADPQPPDYAASDTSPASSQPAPGCLTMTAQAALPRGMEWNREGAVVEGVLCGTPASRAGLSGGDLVIALGGRRVSSGRALTALLNATRPGRRIAVRWLTRAGLVRSAVVLLGAAPAR